MPSAKDYLTNSKTTVPKATYVAIKAPSDEKSRATLGARGGALRKSGYMRDVDLQTGETEAVREAMGTAAHSAGAAALLGLARKFEGAMIPSELPHASQFAAIPDADMIAFSNALAVVRQRAATPPARAPERALSAQVGNLDTAATMTNAAHSALVGAGRLANGSNPATSPIGMLNLERIEMTPAGIERGGLIATIPLAPKERTIVVQQEWSVITQDFQSIVTDSLDNYSETGVTENTQLAQSTTSQVAHANQFNVNTSVSGSCGFVTSSVATSFGTQDQSSQSATDSRQHSVQTTKKASSRVTQSHKVTISTTTTTGTSNATTRMLENPSATDPMRIDYFSIMRKWHCALYRYGLRMTYDITVPEPGAAMRKIYEQIDQLQQSAGQTFVFDIKHSDITPAQYLTLADKYSVDVPPPPSPEDNVIQVGPVVFSTTDEQHPVTFNVPSGYWVTSIIPTDYVGGGADDPWVVVGTGNILRTGNNAGGDLCAGHSFLWHQSGTLTLLINFHTSDQEDDGQMYFLVHCSPTDDAMAEWRSTVWQALYNAAQAKFSAAQEQITAQIAALQAKLTDVDTLTLRREENDEIMKCALRWLLGPGFEFMPPNVIALFNQASAGNPKYGVGFTGNDSGLSPKNWLIVTQHEDVINFINQAIDWDNVIYFVYSYFWDNPQSWDFIRQLQHPDATRQAFLRAGSTRVVLTVRPGWELAWAYFVEFGLTALPNQLPPHPYLTIAQQIMDYDAINYPGIPPANPDGGGPIDDGTPQVGTTSGDVLSASTSPVTIAVADSTGFVVGATAIIDTWDSGVQETKTITAVPDATHIVVQALENAHSVASNKNAPYPIVQAGASGLLIAEWFEYTPTSGTDIAVTSNLATIA